MAVWLRETRYIGLTTSAPRVGPFWTVSLSKTFRVLAFYCAAFLDVHRASLQPPVIITGNTVTPKQGSGPHPPQVSCAHK